MFCELDPLHLKYAPKAIVARARSFPRHSLWLWRYFRRYPKDIYSHREYHFFFSAEWYLNDHWIDSKRHWVSTNIYRKIGHVQSNPSMRSFCSIKKEPSLYFWSFSDAVRYLQPRTLEQIRHWTSTLSEIEKETSLVSIRQRRGFPFGVIPYRQHLQFSSREAHSSCYPCILSTPVTFSLRLDFCILWRVDEKENYLQNRIDSTSPGTSST